MTKEFMIDAEKTILKGFARGDHYHVRIDSKVNIGDTFQPIHDCIDPLTIDEEIIEHKEG